MFCEKCGSVMAQVRVPGTGKILYKCICGVITEGSAEDTLIVEGSTDTDLSLIQEGAFMATSSFDPAANRIHAKCTNCTRDYLTLIRIGANSDTVYTCKCGAAYNYEFKPIDVEANILNTVGQSMNTPAKK